VPRYDLVKIGNSPNWYVQWFEDGHSRRCSTRARSRAEAEAFLAAFRLAQTQRPSGPVTLADILDWYLNTRGPELARLDSAELAVKHLKRFFGSVLIDDLNLAMQDDYAATRREQGVGNETIRRELSVMSAALKRAHGREKIGKLPAMLTLPKAPARERWLTRDEAATLLRYLHAQPRARHLLLFARLALYTGARSGAILDLTWDRVDLERGLIHYPLPGKRHDIKKRAVVPLEPNMIRALAAAKRRNEKRKLPVDHVIQWKGQQCARIARGFTRHAKAAGLKGVTPHTLRHTFATWAAQKGVPIFLLGRTLGQSVTATTERYAKHNPDVLRQVTQAVRRK
jgi:integrase